MPSIALLSRKGGVGKTSTVINLAGFLSAKRKWKTLVIDLDSQASLSQFYLGSESVDNLHPTRTVEGLFRDQPAGDVIHPTGRKNIDIIPSHLEMKLDEERPLDLQGLDYDLVLVDTPADTSSPAAISALMSVDYVLSPIQAEPFAVAAIPWIQQAVSWAVTSVNHDLRMLGYFFNRRERLSVHVVHEQIARSVHGDMVLDAVLRQRVAHVEAILAGKPITEHAPESAAAAEFKALAGEVLARIKAAKGRRVAA